MQDYMKKNAQRGVQQNNAPVQAKETNGIPNSVLQDVFAGKRHADSSMMGHSQNLAPSIAAKMSRAFGMDLTGMQVYQSDAMRGTGMRGMAQGNKVVLSSDVDLNTTAGQAVLGHEISHIHAQSQGVGMGHSGLYKNAALEHQADTEGLLAAQGRSIYQGGMDTGIGMSYGLGMQGVEGLTPLSGGMSASAGAPMQAWKLSDWFKSKKKKPEVALPQNTEENIPNNLTSAENKEPEVPLTQKTEETNENLTPVDKLTKLFNQNNKMKDTDFMKFMKANVPIMKLIQDVRINNKGLTEEKYNEVEKAVNAIWGEGKSDSGIGETNPTGKERSEKELRAERRQLNEEFDNMFEAIGNRFGWSVAGQANTEFVQIAQIGTPTEESVAQAKAIVEGWKNNPKEMAKKYGYKEQKKHKKSDRNNIVNTGD